jgi:hypothetical protein
MKTSIPSVLITFALVCFELLPNARAVTPAPDGAYTGANTAEGGSGTLFSLTTGSNNTALGSQALFSLTTGVQNTAVGAQALKNNTADDNTADGFQALPFNTIGFGNTAIGWKALYHNTIGNGNIALGFGAGGAITRGNNNIDIGYPGIPGETETIHIGVGQTATYIAGIVEAVSTGSQVGVDSDGHLGVLTISSVRFKDQIKPMDKVSEAILALKPITFHYKKELDPKGIQQFGLLAEEVEKVNPDLVARDRDGKPYTVRYEAVNAMLLNEFLKEHSTVQELKKEIAGLTATVKEQASQIQKVSAQLEASKPAPQVVNNPRAGWR